MDGSSGPETKVHRGTATVASLHCFVRLMCLPLRSLLRLRPSFFPERGRSLFSGGAPDWQVRAAFKGSFLALGLYCSQAESPPTRQYSCRGITPAVSPPL